MQHLCFRVTLRMFQTLVFFVFHVIMNARWCSCAWFAVPNACLTPEVLHTASHRVSGGAELLHLTPQRTRPVPLLFPEKDGPLCLDTRGPLGAWRAQGAFNKDPDPCAPGWGGTAPTIRRGHYSGSKWRRRSGTTGGGSHSQSPASSLLHY
jgi:hypothetical protein